MEARWKQDGFIYKKLSCFKINHSTLLKHYEATSTISIFLIIQTSLVRVPPPTLKELERSI
jgi:hypothetical protein